MNTIILNFIHGILFRTHFTKWNTSGRGSVRSLLTGSDVCYNARRNLVDGSGWITGMQRDWPTARNNRIRDNCESFPERRMAVSPAKISRKTILIPLRVIVAPLSRGISLQFAIYEISICGKGGAAGVKLLKFSAISITNGFPLKLEMGILSSIASIARLIVTVSQEIEYNRLKRSRWLITIGSIIDFV